jgi:hypothetical protein
VDNNVFWLEFGYAESGRRYGSAFLDLSTVTSDGLSGIR